MELGPRDVVARAIHNEIISGRGTEHGGVWWDVTHLAKEKILDRLPTMYEQFKDIAGIDISAEKMEVGPTAHYSMGGVAVDLDCRTNISGLFAVGEVIGQIHGANRLGGNSLLDTIVFGKIVGGEAEPHTHTHTQEVGELRKAESASPPLQLIVNDQNEFDDAFCVARDPIKFRNEIQQLMNQNAGIIREETKLQNGLNRILELKKEFYSKENILKDFKIDEDGEGVVLRR